MPNTIPILANGANYAWTNILLVLFGVPVIGITDIEYSEKQAKKMNYGAGERPVSYGLGNKEYMGSITLYKDEIKNILASAPNRSILDIPPFSIQVIYEGDGLPTYTDILNNVMFTEDNFSTKQNDTQILVKVPFIYAGLIQ